MRGGRESRVGFMRRAHRLEPGVDDLRGFATRIPWAGCYGATIVVESGERRFKASRANCGEFSSPGERARVSRAIALDLKRTVRVFSEADG